jgi:hypothetical protein
MHTAATVHDGTWIHVQARRAATLQAAYMASRLLQLLSLAR